MRSEELEALRRLGARIELLDLQVPATASSRVRRPEPEPGDPLQEVPPALRPVLLEHNLYGLQGPLPPPERS